MGLVGKLAVAALALGVVGAAAFWFLTTPQRLSDAQVAALGTGDATRGERIFHAGGCTSCHARPKSTGAAQLELAGGLELKTPFGTFVPPTSPPIRSTASAHGRSRISPTPCCAAFRQAAAISIRLFPIRPMRA